MIRDTDIDAALEKLPAWEPPDGFAARVASRGAMQIRQGRIPWIRLLPRGLWIAAGVSAAAWTAAELLRGALEWAAEPAGQLGVALSLAAAILAGAWRLARRQLRVRITS